LVLRVKTLLHVGKTLEPLRQQCLGFGFFDGQATAFGRIVFSEPEMLSLVDAEARGDVFEFHVRSSRGRA